MGITGLISRHPRFQRRDVTAAYRGIMHVVPRDPGFLTEVGVLVLLRFSAAIVSWDPSAVSAHRTRSIYTFPNRSSSHQENKILLYVDMLQFRLNKIRRERILKSFYNSHDY